MDIILGALLIYASYAMSVYLRLLLNGPNTPEWARRYDYSSLFALALTCLTAFGVAWLTAAALSDEGALRATEIGAAVVALIVACVMTSKALHRLYPHDVEQYSQDRPAETGAQPAAKPVAGGGMMRAA